MTLDETANRNQNDYQTREPAFLGYKAASEESTRKKELQRLKGANQLIAMVLGELHKIQKLMGLNAIAKVESLMEKVKKGYAKIRQSIDEYEQNPDMELGNQANDQGISLPIEKHPLLQDMNGMIKPDQLDAEFLKDLGIDLGLDKAEIENRARTKTKERIQEALKVASKLQHRFRARAAFKPGAKQGNELVVKYKQVLRTLAKPILKPEIQPEYTPRHMPKPRPPT